MTARPSLPGSSAAAPGRSSSACAGPSRTGRSSASRSSPPAARSSPRRRRSSPQRRSELLKPLQGSVGYNGAMTRLKLTLTLLLAAGLVALVAGFTSHRSSPAVVAPAAALQNAFVNVYQQVSPSVVQIKTSSGLGSGIVFDSQGDIVTN